MTGGPGRTAGWQRWVLALSCFPAAIIIASLLAPWWPGSIWSNWTVQAAFALLPALMILRTHALGAACILLLVAIGLGRWLVSGYESHLPLPARDQACVSLVSANVAAWNPWRMAADDEAASSAPDLLCLIEVNDQDRRHFQSDARWPHQFWIDGIGLLSRLPLQAKASNRCGSPLIEASITVQDRTMHLICVHTISPTSPSRLHARERELSQLAALAAEQSGPTVMLGDFNLTAGDPSWRAFSAASGLRRPAGECASWPSLMGPLGIDIDHVLGREVAVASVSPVWLLGSDHRGISTHLALAP